MQLIDLFPYYKISKEDMRAGTPNGRYLPSSSKKLKNKRLKKRSKKR
jgi:hypothetical protein